MLYPSRIAEDEPECIGKNARADKRNRIVHYHETSTENSAQVSGQAQRERIEYDASFVVDPLHCFIHAAVGATQSFAAAPNRRNGGQRHTCYIGTDRHNSTHVKQPFHERIRSFRDRNFDNAGGGKTSQHRSLCGHSRKVVTI